MRNILFVFLTIFISCYILSAQEPSQARRVYNTAKIQGTAPIIDANFDDPAWNQVEWTTDFIQREPYEGKAPGQQTSFKILYDDKNLYLAFQCHDLAADSIEQRLSRRDGFEGDWVEVNIDSYHDLRSAFSFNITAAGVKGDEFVSNNGENWDANWDPIWYVKTTIHAEGWNAELRIPLSQLRFPKTENQVWGIQVQRRLFRKEEVSNWQPIPRNGGNWVSEFGELHGLVGLKPQKQIEIQPYVVLQAETFEKEEGNPFATGKRFVPNGGIDGKIGVSSDLTLDFTVNPDFGQVEADPSILTLDGFQIFFSERRPFFVENKNIFDYKVGIFGQNHTFYSRRIGGAPHRSPDLADGEYSQQPDNTAILGAAKLSGKLKSGLSIGISESVTARTHAEIDFNGGRDEEEVEPLTNYFVSRLQQDFKGGKTIVGGIFTATNRDINTTNDSLFNFLHKSAYSAGLDFKHFWKDRTWYVSAVGVFSSVHGSEEAIRETQESHEHYFQRPDADHLEVDTTLTSLNGHTASFSLGKQSGNFIFIFNTNYRSPGAEINDLGFMRSANEVYQNLWARYQINKPFSIFRNIQFNLNEWTGWDFGGNWIHFGSNVNTRMQFKNYYNFFTGINYQPRFLSNTTLRGGPALLLDKGVNHWAGLESDQRKKLSLSFFTAHYWAVNNDNYARTYEGGIRYRPSKVFEMRFSPEYSYSQQELQFVENDDFEGEPKYINARINRKTFSMAIRLNYTILPNLSIQYYGQPYITIGKYSQFKYITNPQAPIFEDRYQLFSSDEMQYDNDEYLFDYGADGGDPDYRLSNPDFNFMQFRSNLVARWEYIPGSELFLVWSQGNTQDDDPNKRLFRSLGDNLFGNGTQNIFLVKMTYRFLL